ncbi:MAG: prepilin peptidase [Bacillota bacterium]|nr:prepilin peptidase [Bacillota bacterium]
MRQLLVLLVPLLGLLAGSFLNVLIYRLPRGESVAWPGSRCPACGHPLAVRDLIPLVSWLTLRGRCRYCAASIPARYPLVELANVLLYLALYLRFGWRWALLPYGLLASLLLALTFIDLDHQLLPDALTLPGLGLGLAFGLGASIAQWTGRPSPFGVSLAHLPYLFAPLSFRSGLIGAAAGAGAILLIILLSREGMGYGDAKLLAMIGAFVGWRGALASLFLGAVAGSVVGLWLLLTGRKGRRDPIPFGPFLSFGCLFLFFGDRWLLQILSWWR